MKINRRLLFLLLIYCIFYFFLLDKYPVVWIDEPWLSEPSWNYVKYGKFVNLSFTGYYNYDVSEIVYPVFNFILVFVFKVFGLNFVAARAVSVIFGLLTLIIMYFTVIELDKKNRNTALLSVAVLMCNPLFYQCARQIRAEVYISFFILISFYFVVRGIKESKYIFFFFSGILSGMGFLSHFIMLMSFLSLIITILLDSDKKLKEKMKFAVTYIFGFMLILLPWLVFIYNNLELFNQQIFLQSASKISILKGILSCVLSEYKRWLYPSFILPAVFGFFSLVYLTVRNYKRYLLLVNYTFFIILLYFLFVKSKTFLYADLIFPFFSICIAFFIDEMKEKRRLLAVILIFILMFNGIAFISYKLYKFRYSDYSEVCEKIKKVVQKNSVILAPTTYWFGLENDCKFRSFDLPYHFIKEYNESYEHAVKVIDPDYIVIDNYWNKIYANDKDKRENYLKNYCDKIHSITDNYYGRASERGIENKNIIIYKVKK